MTKAHLIKVYREAAESIANGRRRFSCIAVKHAAGEVGGNYRDSPEVQIYMRVMGRPNLDGIYAGLADDPESRDFRILLLLLMAEWVRTDYEG